jgi:hypothetical protein
VGVLRFFLSRFKATCMLSSRCPIMCLEVLQPMVVDSSFLGREKTGKSKQSGGDPNRDD